MISLFQWKKWEDDKLVFKAVTLKHAHFQVGKSILKLSYIELHLQSSGSTLGLEDFIIFALSARQGIYLHKSTY